MRRAIASIVVILTLCSLAQAQDSGGGIRLYLDCGHACDSDFIRTEIPIIDFVTERTEADIHLLITTETTGSGGDVFTLAFLGQRRFQGVSDTLTVAVGGTDSSDERRRTLTKVIQLGLGPYLVRADLTRDVGITMGGWGGAETQSSAADPWNFWVFSFGANGFFQGQAGADSKNVRANVSANRTTEDLKVRIGLSGGYNEQNFDIVGVKYRDSSRRGELSALVVRSIGTNWSAGVRAEAGTSTFLNTGFSLSAGPAIEFDVFPYSESTRRELRIQYGLKLESFWYDEETIFEVDRESILSHSLSVSIDLKQTWGSIRFSTEASHYWTNFDRSLLDAYNFGIYGGADVRLVRGLSLNIMGNYSLIRDQFSLPLSGATDEEVLLRSRRLPTGYDYFFSVGFNFRFGSIFNNVVNPRFGGGGGGMTIIMG